MKYQLIQLEPLQRLSRFPDEAMGFPAVLTIPDDREPPTLPDGFNYVPIEDRPTYDPTTQTISQTLSPERDGWVVTQIPQETLDSKARIEAVKSRAEAAFESLPKFQKSLFKGVRDDVAEAIEAGDFIAAREILESVPTDLYGNAARDRESFLSLLPPA